MGRKLVGTIAIMRFFLINLYGFWTQLTGLPSYVGKDNCAFGILIGLVYNGKPIDQPILKLRWVGVKGKGTTINGESFIEFVLFL